MRKVIIYIRVSSLKQFYNGLSLEDQLHRLSEFCNERGWIVVEIVQEIFPAKTFNKRTKITRILREMKNKDCRFDTIICTAFDRFSRDLASAQLVMDLLIEANVELWTIEKRYNLKTVGGRREFKNDAYRAQDENESRSEKAENGIRNQMRKGNAPFKVGHGYRKIPGVKHKDPSQRIPSKVVFDEKTYQFYQEAFLNFASGLMSAKEAFRILIRKLPRKFHYNTFLNILKNPFYMGKIKYKNELGEEMLADGNHPAMVSPETYFKVQENLKRRSRKNDQVKKRNPLYPLRGFLVCPGCGNKLTAGKSLSGRKKYYHYYNCQRKTSTCTVNISPDLVHASFSRLLNSLRFCKAIHSAYKIIVQNTFECDDAARTNRVIELKNYINEGIMRRTNSIKLFVDGKIEKQDYDLMIGELNKGKFDHEAELQKLENIESSYSKYVRSTKTLLEDFNTFFWTAGIDTQYSLLEIITDSNMEVNKAGEIKTKLNDNFKLLLMQELNLTDE